MVCSVLSENVKILMNEKDAAKTSYRGSALQSPDISRAELAAMLRRAMRTQSPQHRQSYWTAFMDGYKAQTANSNGQ